MSVEGYFYDDTTEDAVLSFCAALATQDTDAHSSTTGMRSQNSPKLPPGAPSTASGESTDASSPPGSSLRMLLMAQTDWAEVQAKGSSAISKNVSGAKKVLSD